MAIDPDVTSKIMREATISARHIAVDPDVVSKIMREATISAGQIAIDPDVISKITRDRPITVADIVHPRDRHEIDRVLRAPPVPVDVRLQKYEALLKTMRGPTIAERPHVAPPISSPITLDQLIEKAKEPTFTVVYAVFRERDSSRVEGDRLLDCILMAPTLDEAVGMLLIIAGYDESEAEMDGLNEFEAGNIFDLCAKLKELTGDTYLVSSFEQPRLPAQ